MSNWKDKLFGIGLVSMMLGQILYGALIIYLGYMGIAVECGEVWAIIATVLAFLGFAIPISIGAVFGVMHVWGWHWIPALLLAIPGIIIMAPIFISGVFNLIRSKHS